MQSPSSPRITGEEARRRFPPRSDADRAAVLQYVREAPLVYGDWTHVKALYKQAESSGEVEILGALIGRLDAAPRALDPAETEPQAAYREPQEVRALAVKGPHAFVAGAGLEVLDLTNPGKPATVGRADVPGVRALAVAGEHLYTAGRELRALDISDPTRPRLVGRLDMRPARAVAVHDSLAYVVVEDDAHRPGGLLVVDVSDPARPTQVTFLEVRGARDLVIAGRYACVAAASTGWSWFGLAPTGGLRVIDLANPRRPRLVGSANVGDARRVALRDHYAYLSVEKNQLQPAGIRVIDLSHPAAPRPVGAVNAGTLWAVRDRSWAIIAHGSSLFQIDAYGGLRSFDITNPVRPVPAAPAPVWHAREMAVSGDTLIVAAPHTGLTVISIANPRKPVRLGQRPSAVTMGYLKRRARRALRRLAATDPDRFVEVACHALRQAGQERAALEPDDQWVTIDLLFGGSSRYEQARHGRGPYRLRSERRRRRTREERAPSAWDRRLDLVRELLAAPALPWEAHESAVKMLASAREPVPSVREDVLARWLRSPSPLLMLTAGREVSGQARGGGRPAPELAARAFFASHGHARREWAARWSGTDGLSDWDHAFGADLHMLVSEWVAAGKVSPRVTASAALLAGPLAPTVAGRSPLPIAVALLASAREELQPLAESALAAASPAAALDFLETFERLPERAREPALQSLLAGFRGKPLDLATAKQLVFAPSAWVRAAGWRLLAGQAAEGGMRAGLDWVALWREVLKAGEAAPAVRTALVLPAALETLARVPRAEAELWQRLTARAPGAGLLSPEALAVLARVAPDAGVRIVAGAEEEAWQRLREPLLASLRESGRLTSFWEAVGAALADDPGGVLARRLVRDREVAETFLEAEAEELLGGRYPGLEPLLLRWVEAHPEQFTGDSPLLTAAATSTLPSVREWGLEQARVLGLELPLALRLLESGLPGPMAAGRAFFEGLPSGDEREMEYALALCDSPAAEVRAFGREYVEARQTTLPRAEVVRHLAEHADPRVQALVAAALLAAPEPPPETARFDREVLRARDRGRRAKELVKRRQSRDSPPDAALLLQMARSRTGRDAEWAWEQLARLALDGQEIDGLTLDGPAGV